MPAAWSAVSSCSAPAVEQAPAAPHGCASCCARWQPCGICGEMSDQTSLLCRQVQTPAATDLLRNAQAMTFGLNLEYLQARRRSVALSVCATHRSSGVRRTRCHAELSSRKLAAMERTRRGAFADGARCSPRPGLVCHTAHRVRAARMCAPPQRRFHLFLTVRLIGSGGVLHVRLHRLRHPRVAARRRSAVPWLPGGFYQRPGGQGAVPQPPPRGVA